MSNIKQLKVNDSNIYPVTHEDAVMDDSGVAISAKYATKENVNAQIAELNNSLSSAQSTITSANNAIGDLSQLQTSNKSSIVAAVNEAFQYGNSVKQSLVDALIAKEVNVSTSNSMSQLVAKIADIEQGGGPIEITGIPQWYATEDPGNFWVQGTDMTAGRQGAAGGAIGSDIYICGGSSNVNTGYQKNTYCYNTKTNEWSTKADMPLAKFKHGSAIINNQMYVAAGYSAANTRSAATYCYNPSTNTWTELPNMPAALNAVSGAAGNNKLYIFGGQNASNAAVATVYCYDPLLNQWSTKTSMPAAKYQHASTDYKNQIYVMGGNKTDTNYCYDVAGDSWSTMTAIPYTVAQTSISAMKDKIYLVGGATGTNTSTASGSLYYYNPVNNQWTTKKTKPNSTYNHVTAVIRNNLYCIGGRNSSIIKTVYCYIPELLT